MNFKILSPKDLNFLEGKYDITFNKQMNMIFVNSRNYGNKTVHDLDKPFSINIIGMRRINFSKKMIDIWQNINNENKIKYSLFLVHQTASKLLTTYQDVTEENVLRLIENGSTKIKEI